MRPIYETPGDRREEHDAACLYAATNGYGDVVFMPQSRGVDAIMCRDSHAQLLIEIKRRRNAFGKYPTLFIGRTKLVGLWNAMKVMRLPGALVVRFDDALCDFRMTTENLRQTRSAIGGRTDRGDPADTEWVVHIPLSLMRKIPISHQRATKRG